MADKRQRTTLGNRFRFLIRGLGLVGLLAAAVGAVLVSTAFAWPRSWESAEETAKAIWGAAQPPASLHDFNHVSSVILLFGLAAVALALVVELLSGLFLVASRRTAAGATEFISVLAAIALLAFVNLYSYRHYGRYDLTREKQFTLPSHIAEELRKLRSDDPTTIVVLITHQAGGVTSARRDSYGKAAEDQVTSKVKDLVDQFREFGPRFNVLTLDTELFGYEDQLKDLTKNAPELKAEIDSAPENSIIFHANKRVQRLSFDEFLQLDKTASKEANGGKANLVLLPQGVEVFARRILSVQERRPKVAFCVIHGLLSTQSDIDDFTSKGLRKTLTDHGFEVTDIVLKKWGGGPPAPAAYTRQESKIEEIEGELEEANLKVLVIRDEVAEFGKIKEVIGKFAERPFKDRVRLYQQIGEVSKNRSWLEVFGVYRTWVEKFSEKVEPEFKKELVAKLDAQKAITEKQLVEVEKERSAIEDKLTASLKDERSIQDRRLTDVKAKFTKLLADVDLLILPRLTVSDVTTSREISPELHALDSAQVAAIKDFMKSGRPVMALVGSISEPEGPNSEAQDGFEKLLVDRGIELGRETIVNDSEMKLLAAQGIARQFGGGGGAEIEPLKVEDRVEGEKTLEAGSEKEKKKPNPIGDAVRLTGRSNEQRFDLRMKALRPVYINPGFQEKLPFAAEFVLTGPDSWNEIKPFATGDRAGRISYVPKYEPTKEGDAKKGTRAEERRGPFPVAVAVDGPLPLSWFDETAAKEQTAAAILPAAVLTKDAKQDIPSERLMVFGSGSIFIGENLKPAQEKLLLHSVNWLLNRSDRLPAAPEKAWSYPRVEMSDRDTALWRGSTAVLMPLGVVILGLIAGMFRRTR